MVFGDDDLKRLKASIELIAGAVHPAIRKDCRIIELEELNLIEALLARLEAAERVCLYVLSVEDMIKIPLVLGDDSRERAMVNLNTAYRAWRKTAGK